MAHLVEMRMPKDKSKSKKSKSQKRAEKVAEAAPDSHEDNKYGGIPDRDLKRNLGCG